MRAFEFDAVVYDGAVYCLDCLPEGADTDESYPIFAGSEWPHPGATCDACGTCHDYMSLSDEPAATTEDDDQ